MSEHPHGPPGKAAGPPARPPDFWDHARRVYERGMTPVSVICARYDLSLWELRRARETGGWTPRRRIAPAGPNQGARPPSPQRLAGRLAKALGAQLAGLETRLREQAGAGAAPDERDMRALSDMALALDRLARLRTNIARQKARPGGGRTKEPHAHRPAVPDPSDPDSYDPAHVAWMRAELKRRAGILARARRGGARPGDR
jgi:hypothetical protein